MSRIRAIVEGTTGNYPAFTDLARRACAFVAENEPGVVGYECYADETSGRFVWSETYADADAFLAHSQNMSEQGFMDEVTKLVEFDRMSVLDPVSDERVQQILHQMGAIQLEGLASAER